MFSSNTGSNQYKDSTGLWDNVWGVGQATVPAHNQYLTGEKDFPFNREAHRNFSGKPFILIPLMFFSQSLKVKTSGSMITINAISKFPQSTQSPNRTEKP
jgi:hypothetical protein